VVAAMNYAIILGTSTKTLMNAALFQCGILLPDSRAAKKIGVCTLNPLSASVFVS
jgi:hypothetical protein